MFKRKESIKKKRTKTSILKASSSGKNVEIKKVALRLITSPTKKNKDAMLKAIIRSL